AEKLEKATIKTIEEDKIVTQDIARISDIPGSRVVYTEEFIDAIRKNLDIMLKP
ncbi:MAG TPA: NADP-dependent isocitrate dehydrogenase, partial [Euryarchaeota archaeon]|nr:NADP-dependent isocitrate dehydrogenase [Euryarchaeota archaeon]